MGKLDQFVKRIFSEETSAATHDGLSFEVPPETPTTEVSADGLLWLKDKDRLKELPFPWCLATTDEIVLEFKMQGDKLDREQVERALLRRQARQCLRAKARPNDKTKLPVWIVAAYLPEWLREERFLSRPSTGCYRLEPAFYEVYWIAANELTPKEELLPFLVARTGRPLVEFAKWLFDTRPTLAQELLEVVPMTDSQFEEIASALKEPDEQERVRRRRRLAEALAEGTGLAQELLTQGQLQAVRQLAALRLGRDLQETESTQLTAKLETHGLERVQRTLLSLNPKELLAWLKDPDAA